MGHREVRVVAVGWAHPRRGGGSSAYRPLHSRAALLEDTEHPKRFDRPVDPNDYMPPIPEGAPYQFVLYETTSEGTPLSPAFGSLEDLAAWCADNATVFMDLKWTREEWLRSFRDGTTSADSIPIGTYGG